MNQNVFAQILQPGDDLGGGETGGGECCGHCEGPCAAGSWY